MAQFSDTLAVFRAWCADKHQEGGWLRIERLARLIAQNNWAIQPRLFKRIRAIPTPNNPWGVTGLNQHEQLELLYYDGFVAGLALASGDNKAFYMAMYGDCQKHASAKFQALVMDKSQPAKPIQQPTQ